MQAKFPSSSLHWKMALRGEPTDQLVGNLFLRDEFTAFFPHSHSSSIFPHFLFTYLLCLAAVWLLSYDLGCIVLTPSRPLRESCPHMTERYFGVFLVPLCPTLYSFLLQTYFSNLQRKWPGVSQHFIGSCSMLWLFLACVAACPSMSEIAAAHCSMSQDVAACCHVLQLQDVACVCLVYNL